jgi:multicomponent Na+:H+ antiporter subunit B
MNRIVHVIVLSGVAALLIYAASGLPNRGDASLPPHWVRSPAGSIGAESYYIRNAMRDTRTPNMVTAVLADYRGYDTLGETLVIFTAGIICALLLRKGKDERVER